MVNELVDSVRSSNVYPLTAAYTTALPGRRGLSTPRHPQRPPHRTARQPVAQWDGRTPHLSC